MTTTTLRPNGTNTNADSLTGGASAHAVTSDDSDSSYWTDNDTAAVILGTTTLGTAVTKQIRLRWRGRGDSVTVAEVERLLTTSVGGSGLTPLQDTQRAVSTTLATYTNAYTPVTLTQTQVDNLRVTFESSDGNSMRVYEVYVDLVTVTQPSTNVDAVSPDPYTASTLVPISWVNTFDTDGGGQTRYQVKAFTDAVYGGGGFDPDTSEAVYDSGEVASSSTEHSAGPLPNDTYRAYVRVAQTVNGALHWSDWDFDQFTVTVTTSDVDTVTLTPVDASGYITVDVDRDTGSSAWDFVEVQRSIDGGTTWVDVRGATYVAPDAADTHDVDDYEVPNGQTVKYRARATRIVSELPITGAWVESSTDSWSSTDQWLKAPGTPSLNTTFCLTGATSWGRRRRSGVFPVVGAAAPVVVSDVRSKRSGTLVVATDDATEAGDVDAILEGASVILVQFPASMDRDDLYITVTNDTEQFKSVVSDVLNRDWVLDFVEVDAPGDPDAGSS